MREKSKERQRVSTMTTMKANVYDEKSSFASTRARVLFLSSFGYDFSGKKRIYYFLCGRTFSSSVARSNLRSSRRLLPNSSTISRRSSSPRTGRREALFYFLLSASCAYKMYIALFLFIRETSLPLVLVLPFVERTGKEKERKKSLIFFFFFFFSRARSCACYLFYRGFAREAVRRRVKR